MKKIKILGFIFGATLLTACTSADIEAISTILTESNTSNVVVAKDGVAKVKDIKEYLAHDLKITSNTDEFGNVKEVFVQGIIENSKNNPIKISVNIPVRNTFGDLVHTFSFEKIVPARKNIRINEGARTPKFVRGKIRNSEIKVKAVNMPRYNDEATYTSSDISVKTNNDALGYTLSVRFNGIIENSKPYPVKAIVSVPVKDAYGNVLDTIKVEKLLNPYTSERLSTVSKIPHYIYGMVNPRDVRVEYVSYSNSSYSNSSDGLYDRDSYNLYAKEIKRNLKYNIARDGLGYVKYINIYGEIRNDRAFPVKVVVSIPLRDDYDRVIDELRYEKILNGYQSASISDIIKLPYGLTGSAQESEITVDVIRVSNY